MAVAAFSASSCQTGSGLPEDVVISKSRLLDKIKGGWAGQAIGCTYGGPTEFSYLGTMINGNIPIYWSDGYMKYWFENIPGLYDDIYMDLTFVDVFEKKGLDAPAEEFAKAFSNAGYPLWHANQQARYNIKNGLMPPASGHWKNNPHADDIDFQIEADYAGLMSPGMVNAASYYCDDIGHIMNYGDGWYGGVYVAAMYALAFVSDDIGFIVNEALKVIPEESKYYRCMSDVIRWHGQYPEDWVLAWSLCEKNWSFDLACPEGVFQAYNIDAIINSAYVLIGLLYGDGDFHKTMDIATRCGQDSDCNPATAAGILGTVLGYSNIPEEWMTNLREVENIDFAYTDISLEKVYDMSYRQALQVIERNGGETGNDNVRIRCQKPEPVRYEESFTGHWPKGLEEVDKEIGEAGELAFEGKGIIVRHEMTNHNLKYWEDDKSGYVARVEVYLDGELSETVSLPALLADRRQELYYRFDLPEEEHRISFRWLNPEKDRSIRIISMVAYTDKD